VAEKARVLVAGASGFTGALAAQIVWRHPSLELAGVTSRSDAGTRLDRLYPRYRVPLELTELDLDSLEGIDAAIVAYPHGASAPTVAALRGLGVLVVDLSADFRLRDLPTYERWYGEHGAPELLEGAVYGLTELYREQLRGAELVATPGCYPTASVLALAPLAERGLLADAVIDAKQGVSGAGRGGGDAMHYANMDENAFAYKTEGHRHRPEIEQELAALGSASRSPSRRCRRSTRSAMPTSPSSTRSIAHRACVTSATPTSATSTSRSRSGAGSSPSRPSTTSGRGPRARPFRTST
jgi:N-acetyl-gamma-glutamyl-phosphate reductase